MVVPDPKLVAQVPYAPNSVRLSTVLGLNDETGKVEKFWIVMSDAFGTVLAKHEVPNLDEVVVSAFRLCIDATRAWPDQSSELDLQRTLHDYVASRKG